MKLPQALTACLLLISAAGFAASEEVFDAALSAGRIDQAVYDGMPALGSDGRVYVYVKLRDEPGFAAQMAEIGSQSLQAEERRALELEARRAYVASNQERVMSALPEEEFTVRYRYALLNGFTGYATKDGVERLLDDDGVERVESVGVVEIQQPQPGLTTFEEPGEISTNLDQSLPLINGTRAWNVSYRGVNVTGAGQAVCIIDSGVNYTHPALGGCTTASFLAGTCAKVPWGYDFGDNDTDPMDTNGGGTHLAGIVASENNTYRGVAPDAKIIPIKVYNGTYTDWSIIVAGIDACTLNRTKYNISAVLFGFASQNLYCNFTICENMTGTVDMNSSLGTAYSQGLTIVAPSGDIGYLGQGMGFPACNRFAISSGAVYDYSGAFSIGGCSDTASPDYPACFSCRCDNMSVWAPGAYVTSTNTSGNGNYATSFGTSKAAAHVAGAAALLQQFSLMVNGSKLTPAEVKEALVNSGLNVTRDVTRPRINVYGALMYYWTPLLDWGAVTPAAGNKTYRNFNFTVVYSHFENTGPSYVQVWVDGVGHTMASNGSSDWAAGVTFSYNMSLGGNTHTYWFNSSDGARTTVTPNISGPYVNSNDPNLTWGEVTPYGGNSSALYRFNVTYSDLDGDAPTYVLVHINGSAHAMTPDGSDNYAAGAMFYYDTTLTSGTYGYYFNASDGVYGNATSPATGPYVNFAPTVTAGAVNPSLGTTSRLFNFTVTYTDHDGDPGQSVEAVIDGIGHGMTNTSAAYSGGVTYYYNTTISAPGTHTFFFNATDGNYTVATSSYDGPSVYVDAPSCTGADPMADTVWNVNVYTFCNRTAFIPTNARNGTLIISGGNTLNLTSTIVYLNNTLASMDGALLLDRSALRFIRV
jgi:hypothetical protein